MKQQQILLPALGHTVYEKQPQKHAHIFYLLAFVFLETGSHYIAQSRTHYEVLEMIVLPQPKLLNYSAPDLKLVFRQDFVYPE